MAAAIARTDAGASIRSSHSATDCRPMASAIRPSHRCSPNLNTRISGASLRPSSSHPLRPRTRPPPATCRMPVNPPGRISASFSPSAPTSFRISSCPSSMRSPPASACCRLRNASWRVRTRPPTRWRASITVTAAPRFDRSRAAVSPANPAPAIRTEAWRSVGTWVFYLAGLGAWMR
jgi:hypothetical protein